MNAGPLALEGRRVLVWGWGSHGGGAAAARFCAGRGARVEILDRRTPGEFGDTGREASRCWPWHQGDATHSVFHQADLVVASPAIPPRAWPDTHPPRTCPEGLFFAAHRGPRVAVTGTKGKSTTARILATLLGWEVGGNSWEPLLDLLARGGEDLPVVCELSSFQLWYLAGNAPRFAAAVLTNLHCDHLDWHPDAGHYQASKLALLDWAEAVATPAGLGPVGRRLPEVRCQGGSFLDAQGRALAVREDLPLPGDHNAGNACLAISAALHLGLLPARVAERLRRIRGLPHRLQEVHRIGELRFIDDSIATTPEAAMAGLSAVEGPLAVILGGSDKGADFSALAQAVARRGARPVLIGSTAGRIAAALSTHGVEALRAQSLAEAVAIAVRILGSAGTILLSPACASFDMFTGFEDRGEQFATCANRLCLSCGPGLRP